MKQYKIAAILMMLHGGLMELAVVWHSFLFYSWAQKLWT